MAEQRPYRVPGFSAETRLARAKRLAVFSLAGAFIAINWVTTQHAASVLRHASWLGRPFVHLRGEAVYTPWSWIVWWTRWYWAPQLEPLWEQCAREALYPMAIVTAVSCAAIAMVRHGWFTNVSDLHGSARWATARDLRGARLIDARMITPDEAMRLGADEALIYTSGRPAIRATKLRYYANPSFKRIAEIAPPSKSDRIENASAIVDCGQPNDDTGNEEPEQEMPEPRPAIQAATGKPRHPKPVPAEQLSFLKFAVESGNRAADSPKEEGVKKRLL